MPKVIDLGHRAAEAMYDPVVFIVCGMCLSLVAISSYEFYVDEQHKLEITAAELDPKLVREVNAFLRLPE